MPKKVIKRTECCNVLKLHADRKATNLIHISEINERKLKSLGYQTVTREQFLCAQCRMHLIRKISVENTDQQGTELYQEELAAEQHEISILSDIDVASDNEMDIDYEPENNNQAKVEETLQEILLNLKNLISETKDTASKILLLRALPKDWSQADIMEHVGCTSYLINKSKNNETTVTPKRGRPSIKPTVVEKVIAFYLNDSVSRPFPGMKEKISVKNINGKRENRQKRLLLKTLEELYNDFKPSCTDEEQISLSSFMRLRPKECVFATDSAAHNVCVCSIHKNTELMITALKKTTAFNQTSEEDNGELLQFLYHKMLCEPPSEACILRECARCNIKNNNIKKTKPEEMVDWLTTKLDEQEIETITYNMWLTSPGCDYIETTEHIDNFADRLKQQLEKYIPHDYKKEKQYAFVKTMQKNWFLAK